MSSNNNEETLKAFMVSKLLSTGCAMCECELRSMLKLLDERGVAVLDVASLWVPCKGNITNRKFSVNQTLV